MPELTAAELDILIAIEVMGWHKRDRELPDCWLIAGGDWCDSSGESTIAVEEYHPASNLLQAFEALDRLCKIARSSGNRLKYHIQNNLADDENDTCQVTFYYHRGEFFAGLYGEHKIPALAICLAIADYLRAAKVEAEEA